LQAAVDVRGVRKIDAEREGVVGVMDEVELRRELGLTGGEGDRVEVVLEEKDPLGSQRIQAPHQPL
jgi:hypothetical protein